MAFNGTFESIIPQNSAASHIRALRRTGRRVIVTIDTIVTRYIAISVPIQELNKSLVLFTAYTICRASGIVSNKRIVKTCTVETSASLPEAYNAFAFGTRVDAANTTTIVHTHMELGKTGNIELVSKYL